MWFHQYNVVNAIKLKAMQWQVEKKIWRLKLIEKHTYLIEMCNL